MMIRLIPKIFFDEMEQGLDLFVNGLGFQVFHQDGELAVVGRDGAKAYVVASPEYAAKDRPEVAIETDTIESLHQEISTKRPENSRRPSREILFSPPENWPLGPKFPPKSQK